MILLCLSVYCFPWKREDDLMGAVVLNVPKVVCHWPWGRESQWPLPGPGANQGGAALHVVHGVTPSHDETQITSLLCL